MITSKGFIETAKSSNRNYSDENFTKKMPSIKRFKNISIKEEKIVAKRSILSKQVNNFIQQINQIFFFLIIYPPFLMIDENHRL